MEFAIQSFFYIRIVILLLIELHCSKIRTIPIEYGKWCVNKLASIRFLQLEWQGCSRIRVLCDDVIAKQVVQPGLGGRTYLFLCLIVC